jgi:hypothetical protein
MNQGWEWLSKPLPKISETAYQGKSSPKNPDKLKIKGLEYKVRIRFRIF